MTLPNHEPRRVREAAPWTKSQGLLLRPRGAPRHELTPEPKLTTVGSGENI